MRPFLELANGRLHDCVLYNTQRKGGGDWLLFTVQLREQTLADAAISKLFISIGQV